MGYDEGLAVRIREVLSARGDTGEKEMFGGLTFMVAGRMCVGIIGEDLMVRVGKERYREALAAPHIRPMDFTGKKLEGYVYVGPGGTARDPSLRKWVEWAASVVTALPARKPAKAAPRAKRAAAGRAKPRPLRAR